jgi:microcystin-dependent protein
MTGLAVPARLELATFGLGNLYANAYAQNLYTALWNNITSTYAPVTGGRGASAAADWAANKPIALLAVLGRSLAVAGSGAGLTAATLGETIGANTVTLAQNQLPNATLAVTGTSRRKSAVFRARPL